MTDKLKDIQQLASRLMTEWNTPGMAAAVIQGDEVIFAEGFGVRSVERSYETHSHERLHRGSWPDTGD